MTPTRDIRRATVLLRGTQVPVTIHGPGDGVPVLLMPGGAVGGEHCFPDVVEGLPQARLLVHDRLGTGASPCPGDGVGVRSWAEDTISLLDQLEVPSVVLVGHSLGGALAAQLLVDHPDRVAGALLLDPTPLNEPRTCRQAAMSFRLLQRLLGLPLVGGVLGRLLRRIGRPKGLSPSASHAYDATFVGDWIGDTARAVTRLEEDATAFSARRLEPMAAPVIVVSADRKPTNAVRRAHEALAAAFGGRCEVWPGTGHSVHLQRPELVVRRVQELLEQVAS